MIDIRPIPAFSDNYFWLIVGQDSSTCAVVDPGDAQPVIDALEAAELNLKYILLTHHHWDHSDGVNELKQRYGAQVYGPQSSKLPQVDDTLFDGDTVILKSLGYQFQVIEVPGHTLDHIAYYGEGQLFCGDTLFAGGCGRLFEGSPQQMLSSLQRLAALPEDTQVFCAHEYTLVNLNFAMQVDPKNKILMQRLKTVEDERSKGQITLPSTMGLEKQTNPFLRCHTQALKESAEANSKHPLTSTLDVFAKIRKMKDQF